MCALGWGSKWIIIFLPIVKPFPCGSDVELSYSWLIMMASGPQHPQRTCQLDRETKGYGKVWVQAQWQWNTRKHLKGRSRKPFWKPCQDSVQKDGSPTLPIWMAESSWHPVVLKASDSARKHRSGITREGESNSMPHLHQPTCIESGRTFHHQQKNLSASSCHVHLPGGCSHHCNSSMLQDVDLTQILGLMPLVHLLL